MAYRRPPPKSPPRNFKVNYIEEPSLETAQVNFISTLVPKLAKRMTSAEDIQFELSQELCKYLKKSVAVLVAENKPNVIEAPENHMVQPSFKFTMNEFLYKIWIHEHTVQFSDNNFNRSTVRWFLQFHTNHCKYNGLNHSLAERRERTSSFSIATITFLSAESFLPWISICMYFLKKSR